MYAKGMTVRDIQSHVQELYGADLSPALISNITEKVMESATEWQARPLQKVYPIIFFDAIYYKVKENGKLWQCMDGKRSFPTYQLHTAID